MEYCYRIAQLQYSEKVFFHWFVFPAVRFEPGMARYKQANATTVKPANPSTEKPVEGKPKIAVKPVLQLAPRFFDKPVNLRAVLQNGLGLKPTFKIRPMLSLSRYYLPNIKSPFCNRFNLQDKPCSFLHSYQKNSRKWVPYREVNDDFKGS